MLQNSSFSEHYVTSLGQSYLTRVMCNKTLINILCPLTNCVLSYVKRQKLKEKINSMGIINLSY